MAERVVTVTSARPTDDGLCAACRKRPGDEGASPLYRVETGWRDKRVGQTSAVVLCEYDLNTLRLRIADALAYARR